MASVVKSSSSVYSTYISTVDHLPCDIVRSLWLVQACNVAADAEKKKLHEILKQYDHNKIISLPNKQNILHLFHELQKRILRMNNEAFAELESLNIQLRTHESMLRKGIDVFNTLARNLAMLNHQGKGELLKLHLDQHYKENPLTSQVQALQERVLTGPRRVIIKHIPGQASGVKIILKLPKGRIDGVEDGVFSRGSKNLSPLSFSVKTKSKALLTNIPRAVKVKPTGKRKRGRPPKQGEWKNSVATQTKEPKSSALKIVLPKTEHGINLVDEASQHYCFCHQESSGDMIACDNDTCPNGEWFHYKCVGLLRAGARNCEKQKWYCSDSCKSQAETSKRGNKRRRTKW